MALAGNLSEFPLTDIIQLVDLSKKTGVVELQGLRGAQRIDGKLYFRDGRIIGAETAGVSPLEAVYTFFTLTSGPFQFIDDVALETPTITVSNEVIIMEGIMRQDAWAHIQQHVPSLAIVPRLVPNPETGSNEINLEAEEWRVLTMVNGKNTVAQIAQRSGLGEFRTCEIIAQLLASGLIEKRDRQAGEILVPELEEMLGAALGPAAPTVLQEALRNVHVADPYGATAEQVLNAINHLEGNAARLLGEQRAKELADQLRRRIRELVG